MTVPDWEEWQAFIREQAPALGLSLGQEQTRQFAVHAAELLRWNEKVNLTAITDPREIAVKHFLDAIVPARYIPENTSLLDIGTGGGFPGLPLKVVIPSLAVTLVDATLKKINFVRQVIRLLSLDRTTAIHGRVEQPAREAALIGAFDTVICRAFDSLPAFVAVSYRMVRDGGRLIAMKGKQAVDEIRGLDDLTLAVNGGPVKVPDIFTLETHAYTLSPLGDQRCLIILTAK